MKWHLILKRKFDLPMEYVRVAKKSMGYYDQDFIWLSEINGSEYKKCDPNAK